jgi:hypothetical protein
VGGELDAHIRELHALHPGLETEFANYSDRVKTTAACLKRGDFRFVDWEINGRSTGGDPDLFKFFIERAHQVLRPGGRLGYLVPSALYNNEGCTGLRHLLLEHSHVRVFYGFENRQKLFPIDSRYKFVCLALEKAVVSDGEKLGVEFRAAFMRHDLQELGTPPERVQVLIKRPELERLSPGTLAFPEFRDERDRAILLPMYGLEACQTPRPLLGDSGAGTWQAAYSREFDMTNDRDLWTRSDGRLWTPKEVCGLDWPARQDIPFAEVRAAMKAKGFWPLYEGKHIEQFLVGIKPVERWLNLEFAARKYGAPPAPGRKLVFRDIASNTNERTCIAAVLPEESCSGNTLATLHTPSISVDAAATVMNSFVFDFATRLKTAGTHLNWTYVSRIAIPLAIDCQGIPSVVTRDYQELPTRLTAIAEHSDAFREVWAANRSVARAYGLTASDFEHILDSFPVFARKRPAFHQFLRERLAEWKAEEG